MNPNHFLAVSVSYLFTERSCRPFSLCSAGWNRCSIFRSSAMTGDWSTWPVRDRPRSTTWSGSASGLCCATTAAIRFSRHMEERHRNSIL